MIKSKFFGDLMKGPARIVYHVMVAALSAAVALSLPFTIRFIAKNLLVYWSFIGNEKIFLVLVEMAVATMVILLSNIIGRSWKDRKLSNMAKKAGLVLVSPTRNFLEKRKMRTMKERVGFARDVRVIGSTGFRTFVDPKGDLHQVIQNCREAKIMFLNPYSDAASARARSILSPEITPERLREQIKKSIDFLKGLKAVQKNIKLKLYEDLPLLKLAIIGDYIWMQHYHAGLDVHGMPEYVFKHDQNTGSLYIPFYQYFMTRWNALETPEYDLDSDELIYRDAAGNEVRREKFGEINMDPARGAGLSIDRGCENHHQEEEAGFPLLLPTFRACARTQDILTDPRQSLLGGLHFGGSEYFLLTPRRSMCETIGWTTFT